MALGGIWRSLRRQLARGRSIPLIDLLYRSGRDFARHHGTVYAAATSYFALISLFPLLILLATVFGWVAHGTGLQDQIVNEIVGQFPSGINLAKQVNSVLKGATARSGVIGLLSLLATMWTASGLFGVLRRALNTAFDVPEAHSYFHGRLYDMLGVVVVGGLALLSVAATAALSIARAVTTEFSESTLLSVGWTVVFFLVPLGVSYAALVLLYRVIPNQRVEMRAIRLGALVAAVAFELVKLGFTLYLATLGSYQQVYGALGSVVALLVFVYLESGVVIFAAELASELAKDRASKVSPATRRAPRRIKVPQR
ncbi:MAG TPA: YihY/virulence factor BrkB family protein [Thermomicrobiaceae bacterium]|nr:YihY/virulence factor BrkB family protein [Thermomicrobiaceae bacterium]